jgi:hypothetical protein
MKVTFQIPDELYRELKAATAREGRTMRDVTISLFEQWLRQKRRPDSHVPAVDWLGYQPPLAHLISDDVSDHGAEAARKSITSKWNERS